jgi:hypothetical protein
MTSDRQKPSFTAGRDQNVAYAETGPATQYIHTSNTGADARTIIDALRAINDVLAQAAPVEEPITGPIIDAAIKEASAPAPDKRKISGYLETALKLATTTNSLTEQAEKLLPHLQHLADWLGGGLEAFRPYLGI